MTDKHRKRTNQLLLAATTIVVALFFASAKCNAQNNIYKIKDNLFEYYKRANRLVNDKRCLAIADSMYRLSVAEGDGKAACIALTIPVRHFSAKKDEERLFYWANQLEKVARDYGQLQYHYFAKSTKVTFSINQRHYLMAIKDIEDMYAKAKADNYPYGIALAMRARGNIYQMQSDYETAKEQMIEALDYMKKNVPDQDLAPTYNRVAKCCLLTNQPETAIAYCLEGLKNIKNPGNYYDIIYNLLVAYYEAGPTYKEDYLLTYEKYKKYIDRSTSVKSNAHLKVLKALLQDDTAEAERILRDEIKETSFSTVLHILLKKGDYNGAMDVKRKYHYNVAMQTYNESPAYQIAEFNASFANSELLVDKVRLEYEMAEQLLQQTKAEAELEEKRKSYTKMLLANDSLNMEKLKDDSMKIAAEKAINASERAIMEAEAAEKKWLLLGSVTAIMTMICYAIIAFARSRRNIRKLNEKHQQLVEALDHAEESERMKSKFVQNLSNDIRTPLNTIVGFSEIMLNTEKSLTDAEKNEIKYKIERNSNTLTTLVNDILQLSFIESERQVVEKTDCDLNDIIEEAMAKWQNDGNNGVGVTFDKDKYNDTTIHTDRKLFITAMTQMLTFASHQTTGDTVNILRPTTDSTTVLLAIDYKTSPETECNERMFLGTGFLNDDMEPYKMTLPVSRAAMTRLGGTARFCSTSKGFARIIISHPLRLVVTLLVMVFSLLCGNKANAQFTKDKLAPEMYQMYVEAQNKRELPEGLAKAQDIYKIGVRKNDKYIQCVGLGVELQHYVLNGNDNKAFATIGLLQRLAKECNDTIYYYMAFSNEIAIHLNNKHTLTALKRCMEQRDEAQRNNDIYGLYTALRSLGDIYRVRNNYIQSCHCYQQALELFNKYKIHHDPTMSILRLIYMMKMDGFPESSEHYIDEARKHARIERYHYLINMEEAMLAFEKNDTARFNKLYEKAEKQKEKYGFRYRDKELMLELMQLTFEGETDEALKLAEKSLPRLEYYHLKTAIHSNEGEWAKALDSYEYEMTERQRLLAGVFNNDRNEMNEIIGNNNLKAENMKLRLDAARLEIEHNKAEAELSKYMQEQRRLIAANNKLKLSKMAAQTNLDSASLRRDLMLTEQQRVQSRQANIVMFVISAFAVMLLIIIILYKRATRRHTQRLTKKNEELDTARAHAEQSDRLKSVFIQNMSHEIRTPLNAIVGFSQLMLTPGMDFDENEKKDFAKTIRHNSELLMTIVSDIISLSELESGRYEVKLREERVNDLCRLSIKSVEHKAKAEVPILFETEVDDNFSIVSDGQRICQVLINYLTNAIKYTEEGHITLGCHTKGDKLIFSVTDTGQGIPIDKQKEIFERFSKLDNFHQGTGLGLNICHLIAEKLGGEVCTDPTYTGGARFLFTLSSRNQPVLPPTVLSPI